MRKRVRPTPSPFPHVRTEYDRHDFVPRRADALKRGDVVVTATGLRLVAAVNRDRSGYSITANDVESGAPRSSLWEFPQATCHVHLATCPCGVRVARLGAPGIQAKASATPHAPARARRHVRKRGRR